MDNRYDGIARDTAGLAPGVRACSRLPMKHAKVLLCVTLALCLSFVPLGGQVNSGHLTIQKSEAHAIPAAIPVAGAALAALAAELGISETALIFGIGAVAAGATGLAYVNYQATGTDTSLPPAPGFKPWDDLTPEEKSTWGSNGEGESWPQNYQENAIGWWALQYGLLDQLPNGDLEPSPEPDPSNDPNGNSAWNKARNALIVLGTGAGGVLLNEALAPLVDNASQTVKDLLFGGSNVPVGSLDINYTSNYSITGDTGTAIVRFMTMPSGMFNPSNVPVDQVNALNKWTTNDWYWYANYVEEYSSKPGPKFTKLPNPSGVYVLTESIYNGNHAWVIPGGSNAYAGSTFYVYEGQVWTSSWGNVSARYVPNSTGSNSVYTLLNANFSGTYQFGNAASYSGGLMSGNGAMLNNINYGQMYDTPSGLSESILNQPALQQFFYNYTNDTPADYKRALVVPSNINDANYVPSYEDFVTVTPEENIVPLPGDSQLPINPDNPPTPDQQFRDDFGEEVGRLLAQPFDQLFPFCLIGDLHRLTEKVEDALYGDDSLTTQDVIITNGTSEYVIPLDDFGLEGIDDITFDLTPILQFGNMVRPWTTSLFIIILLIGTFRFFLYRGGE